MTAGYVTRNRRVTEEWLNHAGSYAVTRLRDVLALLTRAHERHGSNSSRMDHKTSRNRVTA